MAHVLGPRPLFWPGYSHDTAGLVSSSRKFSDVCIARVLGASTLRCFSVTLLEYLQVTAVCVASRARGGGVFQQEYGHGPSQAYSHCLFHARAIMYSTLLLALLLAL